MSMQPQLASEIPREERLQIARGASLNSDHPPLELWIALAADPDAEVRTVAQESLNKLSDEFCAEFLTVNNNIPESIARYFLEPEYARVALLPLLLANAAAPQDAITTLASRARPEIIGVLLEHLDALRTPALAALKENPAYLDWQKAPSEEGVVLEVDLLDMLIEEIEAEAALPVAEPEETQESKQEGVVSKIAKMSVAKRVILALRGTREERAMLIRDGSKVVSRAVMGSPKLSDAEVEGFASLKNVSQDVLRLISMNRKFMKNYVVVRNLVNNPRLPIDIGLTLLHHLMPQDLRFLASNRDVSETLRKMAIKMTQARQQH